MIGSVHGRASQRIDGGSLAFVGGGAAAALSAYLLIEHSTALAAALCALPLLAWLLGRVTLILVLLGASIPLIGTLTGGAGFNLAPSDLLLLLAGAAVFFQAVATDSLPGFGALRTVRGPVLQYSVFMVLLLSAHFGVADFLKTGQRFELFLLPLVVGAFAAATDRHLSLLKAYVIAATAVAVVWPLDHGLGQKNPVGQMIANALLLLVAVRGLRRYAPLAFILVPGLLLTGSRGAVLASLIGLVLIVAFQTGRARGVTPRVLLVAVCGIAVFFVLPTALQTRLTTLAPGEGSASAYSIKIRQQFSAAAKVVIHEHPWVGVGVGDYRAPGAPPGSPPQDPHNVLLLQAAEGGYGFELSFMILVAGIALALYRTRAAELAAAAAAILLSTVAHGFVDVYWARATPVLGWTLVGMACAMASKARNAVEEAQA
jgi:O-Antigen ligase